MMRWHHAVVLLLYHGRRGNAGIELRQHIRQYAVSYLETYESLSGVPLTLELEAGETVIPIAPPNRSLLLYGIYAVKPREDIPHAEYLEPSGMEKRAAFLRG